MKRIKNNINRIFTLLVCLSISYSIFAQTYWKENIGTVDSTGYYHIKISPEIAGLGLRTLKILDNAGSEIPYFIRSSIPVTELKELDMYQLLSNVAKGKSNVIVLRKEPEEKVSRFYIVMKEADVQKQVSIRGSYDAKQWFTVKQKSTLVKEQNTGMAVVNFPEGDYTYYEITIINNSGSPLNITGVGNVKKSNAYGQLIELNTGNFQQAEDKESRKTILSFPDVQYPYYLSKLQLSIKNKEHYNRDGRLVENGFTLGHFSLSSRKENTFFFNNLLIDKDIRIEINNQDNLPLIIESVRMFTLDRYLCAYLEEGKNYHIYTNGNLNKRYDIQDFADEIPSFLPIIKTSGLTSVSVAPEPEPEKKFFEKPLFLWVVIILTGIILVLVCVRMLNEIRKR